MTSTLRENTTKLRSSGVRGIPSGTDDTTESCEIASSQKVPVCESYKWDSAAIAAPSSSLKDSITFLEIVKPSIK